MANEFRVRNGIFSPNIGTESGDFTIDSAADVIIDADGADIILKDDGTEFGRFKRDSSDFVIKSATSNKDIIFKGNDGGSTITALTLDMSAAGAATFNDKITAVGTSVFTNLDISGDVDIDGTLEADAITIGGTAIAAVGTTSITTLGTIGTGTWQGTAIASAYLDSDTAHLSGTQTFSGAKTFSSTISVAGEIQHSGDTNNSIAFGTDTQTYETGGSTRLDISDSGVRLGGSGARVTTILDEDDLATDSDTALSTQQSIKAYVDSATSNSLPSDPNADRILIWDDSAGSAVWGTAGTNLTISGTAINSSAEASSTIDDFWDVGNLGNNSDVNSFIWNAGTSAPNSGTISSALGNIALGLYTLENLTQGDYNLMLSHNAGGDITTGSYNIGLGMHAMSELTTTDYNIAIGSNAQEEMRGSQNVAIGSRYAMHGSTTASNNTGSRNVAIGPAALYAVTSGNENIAIGAAADTTGTASPGVAVTTGSNNILIGHSAGDNITSGSNNVIIGNVDAASATGDDQLKIASGEGDVTWVIGDSSGNLTIGGSIDVDGTANLDNTDIDGTLDVSGIVSIASEIRHTGDTNNSIAFGTDTQTFETGGSTRIDISDSGVRFGGTGVRITSIENNDSLGTSDTKLCTQGNVKAYVDANAGGGGLSNIVEDTSPQLGGDLDTNSRNIIIDDAHGIYDENGEEQLLFQTVANATAYFQIWNGISDSTTATLFGTDVVTDDTAGGGRMTGPGIEATGSATDVGFTMRTKGLGQFVMMNDDTTASAAPVLTLLRYHSSEADDDVLGLIKFVGPDSSMDNPGLEDHRDYAKIECNLIDSNTSSADGNLMFSALIANSHQDLMRLGAHEDDDDAAGVALFRGQMIDHGSNHTLTEADEAGCYIRATAAITLTLPASPAKGEQYVIISDHAGTTTISANGSDTMNGSTSNQTITTRYQAKTFIAVSTSAWIVIG